MTVIDSVRSLFTKKLNPAVFEFFNPVSRPRMKEREFLQAYRGWVYAATNAIAERVADIELHLQEKTNEGWQDVADPETNPAFKVLEWVNDFSTFYDLIFAYAAYQELDGNSFWYLPRAGVGLKSPPVEIWSLDPTRVHVVKSAKDFIGGYVFTNEKGTQIPLDPAEVIHFAHFNPGDPYRGKGTVEAAAISIDVDTFAAEWQRNFFGNSAMPAALLKSASTLNQEQYDRIRANWDAKYKGVANSGKLAILEGNLDYQALSPTAREMQFDNSRKTIRDEILAVFRVPKSIIGITEDVNRANAEASEYVFAKYVIKPKMKFFCYKLNEFFLPLFGMTSDKFRFTFKDPVPDDTDQQLKERVASVGVWRTRNEVRATEGLEPLAGGDNLYVSTLMAPISGSNQPEDPNAGKEAGETAIVKRLAKVLKEPRQLTINVKRRAAKRSAYIEEQVLGQRKVFLDLNDRLRLQLLKNLKHKGVRTALRKGKTQDQVKKDEAATELIRIVFADYKDWVGVLLNVTKDGMKTILDQSGKDAIAETNVEMDFDLNNPRAVEWLDNNALSATNSYADSVKEAIAQDITQGVDEGLSVDEIGDTISRFFDDQSDWRADRLARTETIDAYAQGNLEGYRQSGVVTGKEWLPDDSACDICAANADDGVIDLEDNFGSGDDAPPAHPNCECALQPVLEGES